MAKLNLVRVRAVLRQQHGGPGPHKDGSSQDVHGKKGAGGGASTPGKAKAGKKPDWVKSEFGNQIVGSGNPMVQDIKRHDFGDRLAYGFKFGDDVKATLDDGSVKGGMLVHYADDHFYVDIGGAGWVEVYKTKITHNARAALRAHHGGPGPHKDGSSQDVHGGAGGGTRAPGNQPKKYGQADQKTLIKRIGHSRTRLRDLDTGGRRHSDDYKMFEKRLERDLEEYINRFGELPDWLR